MPYPRILLVLLTILTAHASSFSQKSTQIGVSATFESTSGTLRPGFGALVERQLTKHSGFESGIYYRNYVHTQYVTLEAPQGNPGGPFIFTSFTISERLISVPLLYKYYSRFVNASIGPTFDFYVGWNQRNKSPELVVNTYSVDPNLTVGGMIKVSRKIPITGRIELEPELRYNVNFSSEREYAGFALAAKYALR